MCLRGIQEIFIHPTKGIMVHASLPLVEQDKLFPADEGLALRSFSIQRVCTIFSLEDKLLPEDEVFWSGMLFIVWRF